MQCAHLLNLAEMERMIRWRGAPEARPAGARAVHPPAPHSACWPSARGVSLPGRAPHPPPSCPPRQRTPVRRTMEAPACSEGFPPTGSTCHLKQLQHVISRVSWTGASSTPKGACAAAAARQASVRTADMPDIIALWARACSCSAPGLRAAPPSVPLGRVSLKIWPAGACSQDAPGPAAGP